MSDLDEARAALAFGAALDEAEDTPTRGTSVAGTGTAGPTVGPSAKDPTTLADKDHPVGATEPKLGAALKRFARGMAALRAEVAAMAEAFEAAASETSRGRAVASALRSLKGLTPMLTATQGVVDRAFGTAPASEDLVRMLDRLDEEPLTATTDADRSTEPRKPVDAATAGAVRTTVAALKIAEDEIAELGWKLQHAAEASSRPDAVRASVTDLSKAGSVLTDARQGIAARFKE